MLSTLPLDTEPLPADGHARSRSRAFPSTLSPSLLSDLQRFAEEVGGSEWLPAIAASMRHARPLVLHLLRGPELLRMSVFPRHRLFHCGVDLGTLAPEELKRLHLVHVEPEWALTPDRNVDAAIAAHFRPLDGLLWRIALHSGAGELLPEIRGRVRYRLSPGFNAGGSPQSVPVQAVLQRLRRGAASLDELVRETRIAREPVQRVLNAVYLQAGLIVSRVAPPGLFR